MAGTDRLALHARLRNPSVGRYTVQVTIADAGGLAATSSIVVTGTGR